MYFLALFSCLGLRVLLKFTAMDYVTGFYEGGESLVAAFNILLGAGFGLFFIFYLLKVRRTANDYPLIRKSFSLALFALLCGVSIMLYTLETLGLSHFVFVNSGVSLVGYPLYITVGLGIISALVFIFLGGRAVFLKGVHLSNGTITLVAGVWVMANLVGKFNGYTTLNTISDNMLAVLFMVFCSLFFTAHARTLGGFSRKDGRNYAIPTGLATSLCGAVLVLPNWIWAAANGTFNLPAPMLGSFESLFVLTVSIYSFLFVRHTCLSIYQV